MPHIALYRKIRPRTFKDVVGQKHIVRALCNQISARQVSHAYLFCGTRGTGKTSIARIFSRAINCENAQDGNPCNVCETCQGIFAERNLNVVEIDAASNNGVDNIRDLRDEVKYQPTQGKYKVYVIDEVHMLSSSAFNALLKTLEEPPAHVIFILATTDVQKLPATILSRCQRYDFRRIAAADIIATLQKYLNEESIEYEDRALDYIAYHSDGAMRDALSLLDQSLSLGDSRLTYKQVLDMLGAVDRSRLFEFTNGLAANDSGAVMDVINQTMQGGRDASQFVADLVRHFRDVLVAGLVSDPGAVDFSAEVLAQLREQSSKIPVARLMEFIHCFSEVLREMRYAPHARTALEVCVLRVCVPRVVGAVQTAVVSPIETPVAKPVENSPALKPPTVGMSASILDRIVANWDDICVRLPASIRHYLFQCGLENNDGRLEVIAPGDTILGIVRPKEAKIREEIADKFHLDTPPNIAFVMREGYNRQKPKTFSQPQAPAKIEQATLELEEVAEFVEIEESAEVIVQEEIPISLEAMPPEDDDGWGDIGDEVDADNVW